MDIECLMLFFWPNVNHLTKYEPLLDYSFIEFVSFFTKRRIFRYFSLFPIVLQIVLYCVLQIEYLEYSLDIYFVVLFDILFPIFETET